MQQNSTEDGARASQVPPTPADAVPPPTSNSNTASGPSRPVMERSLWERMRHLSTFFNGKPWAWGVAALATIGAAATEPVIAWTMKPVLDGGFIGGTMPLWVIPTMFMGLFAVRGVMQFLGQYALSRISNDGMVRLRHDMFERLLKAEMGLFSHQSASTLANTVVYEAQTGSQLLVQALLCISRDGFSLIALLLFLLYTNWQLTMMVTVLIPGVSWIMKVFTRRIYRFTKASQQATDELAYVVEENVLANRMVRLYDAQTKQAQRFGRLSGKLEGLAIKSTIAQAAITPLTQLLSAAALSVVVCIAMWQSRNGAEQVTIGGFMAFVTAMTMLIAPLRRITEISNVLTRGVAALERGLILIEDIPNEPDGALTPEFRRPSIELRGVSVLYADAPTAALENLDLRIHAGEIVALVGASGSGKTTIANLLPRFVLPTRGEILIGDIDITQWQLRHLRQQFAMVSQDVVMFNDSIAANVAMGQEIDESRVLACLEAANLGDFIAGQIQGIETPVGHNASQLSGGQRQRLAIARALYKDAPILILDEATSALDTASERLVQEALQRLMKGRTTLIIAHRLSTIEHADRVIVLEHGHIAEQGTHTELMQRNGIYARLQHNAGHRPE